MKAEKPVPISEYNSNQFFPTAVLNENKLYSNDIMILPEGFDSIRKHDLPPNATPYKDFSYLDEAADYEEE